MNHYSKLAAGAAAALALGVAGADDYGDDDDDELPFDEAFLYFELNDTDGDLGIHGKVDGGPWTSVQINDPDDRRIMIVRNGGRLRRQGLTELFFESAEPPFDELAPERFFKRFPEGTYEIEGRTLERRELESEVELTHVIPAPAVVRVNGQPMALQCEEDEDGYDAPQVSAPITISWDPVTMSHPDSEGPGAAVQPPVPVEIVNYEIVVEAELEIDGDEFVSVFSVILPPEVTSMTVPSEMLALTDTFKYELLAREQSYNQTAVESCFELVP